MDWSVCITISVICNSFIKQVSILLEFQFGDEVYILTFLIFTKIECNSLMLNRNKNKNNLCNELTNTIRENDFKTIKKNEIITLAQYNNIYEVRAEFEYIKLVWRDVKTYNTYQ